MKYANICRGQIILEEKQFYLKTREIRDCRIQCISLYAALILNWSKVFTWLRLHKKLDFIFQTFPFVKCMYIIYPYSEENWFTQSCWTSPLRQSRCHPSRWEHSLSWCCPPPPFKGKMLGIFQEKCFSHNSGSSSKLTIWWSPSSPLCWHHCPSWWSSSGPHHPSAPSSWSPCLLDNFGVEIALKIPNRSHSHMMLQTRRAPLIYQHFHLFRGLQLCFLFQG